jgi:hypothetical protein
MAPLEGHGIVEAAGNGVVDVGRVLAGLHMDVFKGGQLIINNGMQFQGTISEDNGGLVDVLNAGSAVREVLHQATDTTEDWLSAFASPSLAPCSVAQRGTYSMRAVARELIVGM